MCWNGTKSRGVATKQKSICCYALTCRNIKDNWEREWGGDEQGMLRQAQHNAYPPALPTLRQAQGKHGKGACCVMSLVTVHSGMGKRLRGRCPCLMREADG